MVRVALIVFGCLAALPALAGEMSASEARRFVVGKVFFYNCFEGTRGTGRVMPDGSVIGTIQFRGEGPVRYAALPPGTLRVKGESVCASLRGMFFEPCFRLNQTDAYSFRGSLSGLGFAYCDFTRHRTRATAERSSQPLALRPSLAAETN